MNMNDYDYDITNDVAYDTLQPYTFIARIVDIVFNFLTAVGVIAFAGIAGYFYARYL